MIYYTNTLISGGKGKGKGKGKGVSSGKGRGFEIANWREIAKDNTPEFTLDFNRFPYRKDYIGSATVKVSLDRIFEIKPIVLNQKWEIPNGKIVNKISNFNELFPLSNTVVTSVPNHWDYDKIIDYYSEDARIKTPGYGEKHSVYDYWHTESLRSRFLTTTVKSLEEARELLYEHIQEARPAYILVSKSLYHALSMLRNSKNDVKILDIAAYGERAIAAAALKNVSEYDGVDPNYDLIPGHDQIIADLNYMNANCCIRFIHMGLEDYKSVKKYDIITYSPPPFNTEPYGHGQESQSYNKYPTFNEYICKFIMDIIYKAKQCSVLDGIFSLTFLDRNPSMFKINLRDIYKSDNTELIYTELLLLLVSCVGFNYIGAIGLSAGGKKAGVPWWTFKNTNDTKTDKALELLDLYYPDIFNSVGDRLISNMTVEPNSILNKYKLINKTDLYHISNFIIDNKRKNSSLVIILELIRKQIQNYIIETIQILSNLDYERIRTILGRYLMLRSITATYEEPWRSCLYLDPMFPTSYKNKNDIPDTISKEIHDTIVNYLIEKNMSKELAHNIVYDYKYWIGSYEAKGIEELYHCVANYIHSLPLNGINIEIFNNDSTIIKGNDVFISLLRKIPSKSNKLGISNIIWKGKPDIDLVPYLRYETLGAQGHQYTRSNKRTIVIEKILGMPIIDIYASVYNNQSEKYCSIYNDIEDSIGSAFCLKMLKGAYLANPVDIPVFVNRAIDVILSDLQEAKEDNRSLFVSMAFTVWTDIESLFINDFTSGVPYKDLFAKSKSRGLNLLSDSEFVILTYILDKQKYPSVLLDKVSYRDNTISVGVILGTSNNINLEYVSHLVKDPVYIQKNKAWF